MFVAIECPPRTICRQYTLIFRSYYVAWPTKTLNCNESCANAANVNAKPDTITSDANYADICDHNAIANIIADYDYYAWYIESCIVLIR